ncbi:hypothetical protein H9Y04_13330 [Streptomyces sp. TRM66268-LWL]|uniref:Uncharacterized protein n=1 Tax=Streptomyces polyasparticus TaxID=2767826 RepID=A0ABR7SEZ4_9ACTN|nr:hypothetical protein [Streptomyces polyasparticus]MBC9713552.1 hypothetical protein [Streptomyces polyasparticus]
MEASPPLWFRLPPGYQPFDPASLTPVRAHAPEWVGPLDEIFRCGTFYAALGLHWTDVNEVVTTSLFTLSAIRTSVRDPAVAAARALVSRARWPHWTAETSELRTIARATPAAFTAGVLRCGDVDAVSVSQAAYSFLVPGAASLATAALTTPDLAQAEAYAEILGAVADTISFEEPASTPAPRQPLSRISELLT